MANRADERRERALALGPPIYGLAGQKPLAEFGSSWTNDETTALMLYFGPKGWRPLLGVQTTTEPVHEATPLLYLVGAREDKHSYPLTIDERTVSVDVDTVAVEFRILAIGEDLWSGAAAVADRWVLLKGVGLPAGGIQLDQINIADL